MASPTSNNDLLFLIKGLSGNEKSYYKKLAKRHAANNNSLHLRLFDLIDRDQMKDEKKVLHQLGISNPAQYSSLKNYLTKDVLDTIVFMKRNEDIDVQLSFIIIQLQQLLEKKLLHLARRLLKKAWELATYFEHYNAQLQLLHVQSRILEHKSYKEYKTEAVDIAMQMRQTVLVQHVQQQIYFHFEQLQILKKISWLRFTDEQAEEIRLIKNSLLSLTVNKQNSQWTWMLYINALSICEHMLLNFAECNKYCEEMLAFWQEAPAFINAYPSFFLVAANTAFYNGFAMQEIEQVAHDLNAYQVLADGHIKNEFYRKQWQIISFNTTLKIHHKTARYDKVELLIDDAAKKILEYSNQVSSPPEMLPIMTSIAISYFVLEKWKEADEIMIESKALSRDVNREDIMLFSLVFHLLVLYEKKEWYRLDNAIESAYHLLYSRKKLHPFEKELMLFLKRLPTARSKNSATELIQGFLIKLEAYKNDPVKNLYFLYFNYYGWLQSKVMDIPYREYMQRKVANAL